MPKDAIFRLPGRQIEVAANVGLRASVRIALLKFDCLTSREIADWAYWHRPPISRLGAQWRANKSMRSATRRAIAALRRKGEVIICGRSGRARLYALRDGAANFPHQTLSTLSTLGVEREQRRMVRRFGGIR